MLTEEEKDLMSEMAAANYWVRIYCDEKTPPPLRRQTKEILKTVRQLSDEAARAHITLYKEARNAHLAKRLAQIEAEQAQIAAVLNP